MFPVINLSWPRRTNGEISFRTLTPDGGTFAKSSGHYYSPFRLTSGLQNKKTVFAYFNDLLYEFVNKSFANIRWLFKRRISRYPNTR